jgi:heat shock protein HslJ
MQRTCLALVCIPSLMLSLASCTVEPTPAAEIQPIEATPSTTPPPSATVPLDMVTIEEILDVQWLLNTVIESVPGGKDEAFGEYNLLFMGDDTFTFRADCNHGAGSYRVDGSSMSLEIDPLTLGVCEPGSFSEQYVTWLGSISSYGLREGELVLRLAEGQGEMWYSNMGVPEPTRTPTPTSSPEGTVTPIVTTEETPTPIVDAPPQPAEIIYSDDFSVNQYWYTGSGSFGEFRFVGGAYEIANDVLFANLWSVRSIEREDIGQEVDLKLQSGQGDGFYGVMCRVNNDVDSYYAFTIGGDGFYGIGIMEAGEFRFLDQGVDSGEVIDMTPLAINKLRGDCIGDALTLYVNDQLILEVTERTHTSGEIGLVNGTSGELGQVVRFDNYSAFQP